MTMETLPETVALLGKSGAGLDRELRRHGLSLSPSEAQKLCGLLGRDPTRAEAFLFDVAWSEHCSYKSSRSTLATFFGQRPVPPHVVLGPGEDAGIVRLAEHRGRSYCLVMSHESHNHPSQVLPLEGAATGIGGIVRDVYCMGADVVGVLDALRLGDPRKPRSAEIARGVVEGIWRYGNALGVANLGGDVYFDGRYDDNCLVNVVAIGIVEEKRIVRSRVPRAASREPYVAILIGKPTDSTGFGGASFASADLSDESAEQNLGAVQVADPFLKRVLAEANRVLLDELHEGGVDVGFKDLGAGGIGGATIELAAAADMGVTIFLDNVRTAEADMSPEAILVSETQERFVWAVPERVAERVLDVYQRDFELPRLHPGAGAVLLGRFTDDGLVVVRHKRRQIVSCRARDLTEGLAYERRATPPRAVGSAAEAPPRTSPPLGGLVERFLEMLGHPDGASRAYVYRHYDSEVGGRTVLRPGESDAAVIAPVPGAPFGVAIAVDGNPYRAGEDGFQAGAWAVAGAVRNVATVGARPIALSDCLNFGNPEDPEIFWQFREAVRGIAETADEVGLAKGPGAGLPIISGNVSFYNQSAGGRAIPPSPIVACVGMLDDVRCAVDQAVKAPGHVLVWAGSVDDALATTLYGRVAGLEGEGPRVRPDAERAVTSALVDLARRRQIESSHDVSEGGLLTAVFEMLTSAGEGHGFGARIDLDAIVEASGDDVSLETVAFGEGCGVVVAVEPERADAVREVFAKSGVAVATIGEVTRVPSLVVRGGGEEQSVAIDRAIRIHQGGLVRWLS